MKGLSQPKEPNWHSPGLLPSPSGGQWQICGEDDHRQVIPRSSTLHPWSDRKKLNAGGLTVIPFVDMLNIACQERWHEKTALTTGQPLIDGTSEKAIFWSTPLDHKMPRNKPRKATYQPEETKHDKQHPDGRPSGATPQSLDHPSSIFPSR
jgi:hypothetical protein